MTLYFGNCKAGKTLHGLLLRNILSSPMAFFDTTPAGRVLNRFGKDVDVLDNIIANNFKTWFRALLTVISVPIIVGMSTPLFLPIMIPMGIIYFVAQVSFLGFYLFQMCFFTKC